MTAERAKLAEKYLSPEAEKARAERAAARGQQQTQGEGQERKRDFIALPKIDDATRNRITKASVFTMSDGESRAVKATIDGVEQPSKRIPDGLRTAFLAGYKDLTPEQRTERVVQVAAFSYSKELKAEKVEQEQSAGMKR